jgi:hypothetical protein
MATKSTRKPKDPEWNQVNVDEHGDATCKACGTKISARIARIRTHLQKCIKSKIRMEQALTPFHYLAYLTDPQNLHTSGKFVFILKNILI